MSSDWQTLTLAQAGIEVLDSEHRTPPAASQGHPYIAIPQLRDGHVDLSDVRRISDADHAQWTRRLRPQAHDVVVVRRCSPGVSAVVPEGLDAAIGQNLVVLRADGRRVLPAYLRWLVRSEAWWTAVRRHLNVGAVFDSLRCSDIPAFRLPVPPLHTQARICAVLEPLDRRIVQLRQTGATLEALVQSQFRSWFIDFDPVRARACGHAPKGLDARIVATLPAAFEPSVLGPIPAGWRVGGVHEVACVRYGLPFASSHFNREGRGRPLVRIRDLRDEQPGVWTTEVLSKAHLIEPGQVLAGMDGEFRAYLWSGEAAWMNQRVCAFEPRPGHGTAFVQHALAAPLAQVEATQAATTVIHLGKRDIDGFRIVLPPPAVAAAFEMLCRPLQHRIVRSRQAARTLAALRDELLPQLVSGQRGVDEVDERLGRA